MAKTEITYFRVDPAGNITALVTSPVAREDWVAVGKALMEEVDPSLEQVGFIHFDANHRPNHMDMMGGEFCGNATRSFALWSALQAGLTEPTRMTVSVSGARHPLQTRVEPQTLKAWVEMDPALACEQADFAGGQRTVVVLPGITHLVLEGVPEDPDLVKPALDLLRADFPSEAYGVLFLDPGAMAMVPYVYVTQAQTLYREGSCGSGTVAVGTAGYRSLGLDQGKHLVLHQPGGSLDLSATEDDQGRICCTIGGPVAFQAEQTVEIEI